MGRRTRLYLPCLCYVMLFSKFNWSVLNFVRRKRVRFRQRCRQKLPFCTVESNRVTVSLFRDAAQIRIKRVNIFCLEKKKRTSIGVRLRRESEVKQAEWNRRCKSEQSFFKSRNVSIYVRSRLVREADTCGNDCIFFFFFYGGVLQLLLFSQTFTYYTHYEGGSLSK